MGTTTQLYRLTETYHTYLIAILLAEQHHRTSLARLINRALTTLVERVIGTDRSIYQLLNLAQLLIGYLLEVREVETQTRRRHHRALLLNVRTKHLTQRSVQEVGCGMVVSRRLTLLSIDLSVERRLDIRRHLIGDMNCQAILLLSISYSNALAISLDETDVTNLTTRIAIERSVIKYDLVVALALSGYATITCNTHLINQRIVARKFAFVNCQHLNPVVGSHSRSVTRTLLLRLQLLLERGQIDLDTLLASDQLGQVDRETVGIIEQECIATTDLALTLSLGTTNHIIEQIDTRSQRTQERTLLLRDYLLDQCLLSTQLGELIPHLLNQACYQPADKRLIETEIGITVTNCTAQNSTNYITRLNVRRQLTVGNRECNSAQMVSDNTHCHVALLIDAILLAAHISQTLNRRLEYVGIVVRLLALQNHTQTLETHTRINVVLRQRLQRTVSLAVELHKYVVPNLNHLRVVLIDHFATGDQSYLCLVTQVEVDLATRTARTGIAHFPEVILFVTTNDMVGRQETQPEIVSLLIERNTVLLRALEYGCIHTLLRQFIHLGQQLPRPFDSLFLEIVAKRPVTEHLEHRVVIGIVSYLLQVVVLTRNAQTLLRIANSGSLDRSITQKHILELVHTCIGEHQRRIILYNHRCRRHYHVAFALEKFEKGLSNFVAFHCLFLVFIYHQIT